MAMTGARADKALLTDDHCHGFIQHRLAHFRTSGLFDQGTTLIAIFSGILSDFLGNEIIHEFFGTKQSFK